MRTIVLLCSICISAVSAFTSDAATQKVDELFAQYDKPGSPGCSVGIIRDGKFAYRRSFGEASLELSVPLTSQSVFYMASVSKQFTAASIVLAAEQGFLSLDDDVRKYIPELPDYGHRITLRQMLHQSSGFRDFFALLYLSGRDDRDLSSPEQILKLITRQKGLNNAPGAEFVYSNSNYFLLSVVVQRTTHKTLAEFAADNIFKPLGMAHTLFYDSNKIVVPGRVAAYDNGSNGKFLADWSTAFDIVGSGGLMSTVDDLLLWDCNSYANKLGKGALVKELEAPGMLNNGKAVNYGMGLWLGSYHGLPTVEHSGGTFGYRTEFLRFPQQRFSVIELCNLESVDVEGLARKIADIYLKGESRPTADASAKLESFPDPAPFAGQYYDSRTHMVYTFTAEKGNLTAWGAVLPRAGINKFYDLVGNPITFDESNGVMKAKLELQGENYFDGTRFQPMQLTAAELLRFTGKYRSEELDVTYTITIQDGKLALAIGDKPPLALQTISPNTFRSPEIGTVLFEGAADHHKSGLTVYVQAARAIYFRNSTD